MYVYVYVCPCECMCACTYVCADVFVRGSSLYVSLCMCVRLVCLSGHNPDLGVYMCVHDFDLSLLMCVHDQDPSAYMCVQVCMFVHIVYMQRSEVEGIFNQGVGPSSRLQAPFVPFIGSTASPPRCRH